MKNIKRKSIKNLTNYQKKYLLKEIGKSMNDINMLKVREMHTTGGKGNYYIWITFFVKPNCTFKTDPSYRLMIYSCGKILFQQITNNSNNPEEEDNIFDPVCFNSLIIYKALNTLGFNYSI
jgi:hypothetical protein